LPALNAYLHRQIAEAMKHKKRHEPPRQCSIQVGFRIPETLQETADTPRTSRRRERTWTEQIVFTPTGHDVTKVYKRREPPTPGVFLKEDIFRIVLPCQDDRSRIQGNERRGIPKQMVQPVQIFLRQAQAFMPRPASFDLPANERSH
jgi:hypothetical protein